MLLFICLLLFIIVGCGSLLSFSLMVFLNSSQLTSLKLYDGISMVLSCMISSLVVIGKWSVNVGCSIGSTLHLMIRSSRFPVQNRLSGLSIFLLPCVAMLIFPWGVPCSCCMWLIVRLVPLQTLLPVA